MERSLNHAAAIDDLLARYCEVLDGAEYTRWPELFAEDCSYAIYAAEDAERGLPLAYMLDDNRARVLDRVKFINEVWRGTVTAYRTRHIVQRTAVKALNADTYDVRASFVVTYIQPDGVVGLLASGRYEDRIRVVEDGAHIVEKRAYLDGMPPRYLIYPL